jgi:peptidoglycan/LPS O-acetylase OafA/YrhL
MRITALDGLRALAVILVLVQHGFLTELSVRSPGPIGVRLFFVLSGFLITGILVKSRSDGEQNGVSMMRVWKVFCIRRSLRIFPLAYLAMGVAWVAHFPAMREAGMWYWTYLGDLYTGWHTNSATGATGEMTYFWSLAVEEQFYLFWPLVILWLPRKTWAPISVSLIILAWVARLFYGEIWSVYALPWCRVDALAFGALLSLQPLSRKPLLLVAAGMMVIAVVSHSPIVSYSSEETTCVFLSGVLMLYVIDGVGSRVLNWSPLVAIGTVSYGVYVWGGLVPLLIFPVIEQAFHQTLTVGPIPFVVLAAVTLTMAMLSWHGFERPFNNLKRYVA